MNQKENLKTIFTEVKNLVTKMKILIFLEEVKVRILLYQAIFLTITLKKRINKKMNKFLTALIYQELKIWTQLLIMQWNIVKDNKSKRQKFL